MPIEWLGSCFAEGEFGHNMLARSFYLFFLAPLQPGFRFVIADAGGGTVDVSTFEITQSSPIQLKECVPPDGNFGRYDCLRKSIDPLYKVVSQALYSLTIMPEISLKVRSAKLDI